MGVSLPGGGGKRSVVADLNLVPFIDLLSACIAFLLMTAVWTSVYKVDASLATPGHGPRKETRMPAEVTLEVVLQPAGALILGGAERERIAAGPSGRIDPAKLAAALRRLRETYPGRRDLRVTATPGVLFEGIADALDAGLGAGFSDLSVSDSPSVL